jgi:ubiquitin-conjugating enzyme E2 G1
MVSYPGPAHSKLKSD